MAMYTLPSHIWQIQVSFCEDYLSSIVKEHVKKAFMNCSFGWLKFL